MIAVFNAHAMCSLAHSGRHVWPYPGKKTTFELKPVFSFPPLVCFVFCWSAMGGTGKLRCEGPTWEIALFLNDAGSSVNCERALKTMCVLLHI